MHNFLGKFVEMEAIHCSLHHTSEREKQFLIKKAQTMASKTIANNLKNLITLKVGLPVELHMNIDTQDGLVNGASGVFRGLAKNGLKSIAWVEFDDLSVGVSARARPSLVKHRSSFTPVMLSNGNISAVRGKHVVRYQFALVLASGRTVHHAQGSTFSVIAINLQKTTARPNAHSNHSNGMPSSMQICITHLLPEGSL
jgi:hypothetical protein